MSKIFKIIGIIAVGFIILAVGASLGDSAGTAEAEKKETTTVAKSDDKPKEGDVLEGIGRKELEDNYNKEKEKSKLKADQYIESIKGQPVVWVGKVDNVDTNPINNTPFVTVKMGIYTVRAYDKASQFSDLEKGQLVKVTGTIESIAEFIGVDVYLDATTIEVI